MAIETSWFRTARTLRVALLVALLALAASLPVQTASAASAVEQMRAFLAQTRSAEGEFTQRVERGGKAVGVPSSGRFAFQRPGKFRWSTEKPYPQLIVADGAKLYLFDQDLNQVTVKSLSAAVPASPASLLFGDGALDKEFSLAESGARDGLAWLTATPRIKDSAYEKIEIGFRDGVPAAMQVRDAFGQVSFLVFSAVTRNPKIDESQFRFSPPAGADVLVDK
jgi:outer membrane lipoprotein carrier protein